jgi:hypothetical protein
MMKRSEDACGGVISSLIQQAIPALERRRNHAMTSHVTRSCLPQSETETAEFGTLRMRYSNLRTLDALLIESKDEAPDLTVSLRSRHGYI